MVAVDSYASTSLGKSMARYLLDSLSHLARAHLLEETREPSHDTMASILGLANDLQTILGEAIDKTTAMSPHKLSSAPLGAASLATYGSNQSVTTFPIRDDEPKPSVILSGLRPVPLLILKRSNSTWIPR